MYGYSLVIGRYPGPGGVGHVTDSMIFQTGIKTKISLGWRVLWRLYQKGNEK